MLDNSYCHLYADDTIIIQSATDPDSLISSLETELISINKWLSLNKMTINTDKTECLFFGNQSNLQKIGDKTISYLDTPLKRKEKVKCLGVLFDEKMQWDFQIKNISQKAQFKMSKIKSIAQFLTDHTKKVLINALVMPYFHYCTAAWSNAAPFRLNKLEKRIVEASNFLGREAHYSINDLIEKEISILTFKALNGLAPDYLNSKVRMTKNSHSHNTRGAANNHIQIPSSNTKFGVKTFSFRAAKIWNDLPSHISDEKSLLKFKELISDYCGKI